MMPIYGWILIAIGSLIGLMILRIMTATSEAPAAASDPIASDGKPRKLEGTRYLEYRVGIAIAAAPDVIWKRLTDAPGFPSWNSTVISIGGKIAQGEQLQLKAKVAPDRTFPITVSTFEPTTKMIWQDGNRIFKGVRTFLLKPQADGTTVVTMAEVLTGAFLPQIAPKLPDFLPAFEAFAKDLKTVAEEDAAG